MSAVTLVFVVLIVGGFFAWKKGWLNNLPIDLGGLTKGKRRYTPADIERIRRAKKLEEERTSKLMEVYKAKEELEKEREKQRELQQKIDDLGKR